jgi:uncharacterized protein (DUF1697 family)
MRYIILLRGINISGKNKIAMSELKELLEKKYANVITYLNSGNVILDSDKEKEYIINDIHSIIKENLKLDIPIYAITHMELKDVLEHSPEWWGTDNKEIYDNLIFIMSPTTYEIIYNCVGEPSKDIDKIKEYNNVVFWSFDLNNYRKSNWWVRTASTDIKDQITIRTANTIKKLLQLCNK